MIIISSFLFLCIGLVLGFIFALYLTSDGHECGEGIENGG